MQHKTLASAVEAIMNNECSIKNDDVGCLRRACKFVWPKKHEPLGGGLFYYKLFRVWDFNDYNPRPHFITATEFCRLMDEDKAEPIDLGKVFDENSVLEMYTNNWFITREKFIGVVSKLLTEKSKS